MNWLGLPGFEANEPKLIHDDEGHLIKVEISVRTKKSEFPICCLAQKLVKNGRKEVRYRDRRMHPAPTWLIVQRQRVKCHSCGAVLYEDVPYVDDRHYITARLRHDICMGATKRTFADVAAIQSVEETLARRVFRTFADEKLLDYRYEAPQILGIDENHVLGEARGVIVDVRNKMLLDVLPGRTQSDLRRGFSRMDSWENVEVWCQDMAGPYKGLANDLFPKAMIVVDKFHVLTKANYWWTRFRVKETPKLPPEVREKIPGLIRAFDRHWDQMKRSQQDRVAEVLACSERLTMAWTIKEKFYYFYDANDRVTAEKAYADWVQFVIHSGQHDHWKPLLLMMKRWRTEIFNHFDYRWTSAIVERLNRDIKDINRAANGMDFQTLRAKAILKHGRLIKPSHLVNYYGRKSPVTPLMDTEWLRYEPFKMSLSTRNAG